MCKNQLKLNIFFIQAKLIEGSIYSTKIQTSIRKTNHLVKKKKKIKKNRLRANLSFYLHTFYTISAFLKKSNGKHVWLYSFMVRFPNVLLDSLANSRLQMMGQSLAGDCQTTGRIPAILSVAL